MYREDYSVLLLVILVIRVDNRIKDNKNGDLQENDSKAASNTNFIINNEVL
jgi:hypothetical protein